MLECILEPQSVTKPRRPGRCRKCEGSGAHGSECLEYSGMVIDSPVSFVRLTDLQEPGDFGCAFTSSISRFDLGLHITHIADLHHEPDAAFLISTS